MTTFSRSLARRRLRNAAVALRMKGPKHAGKVARIEAVLAISGWPFESKRYVEFCKEIGIPT